MRSKSCIYFDFKTDRGLCGEPLFVSSRALCALNATVRPLIMGTAQEVRCKQRGAHWTDEPLNDSRRTKWQGGGLCG